MAHDNDERLNLFHPAEQAIRDYATRPPALEPAPVPLRNRHHLTSAERKQMPVHRGVNKYFPDALMMVAMLSLRADRKHTPGADPDDLSRPQWVKQASADHGDCLSRHQMDVGTMDREMGLDYAVHVAWRGLAQLQDMIDRRGMDPLVDWQWEAPNG